MQVKMNTVVTISYELKDADGNILEKSKDPIAYLHGGHDNIFPKVEEAIHGKKEGDKIEIGLEPADAFGEYDEQLVQIEPITAFPESNVKEGMQFEGENESGDVVVYTVTNVADGKVVVDGNHPWAGQRVVFSATIDNVRDANAEEISHKHVHGEGGHHH
ncbi:MAG: peptidylprolyl isomerase [Methylophilaceae bacterium]|nr:peptidylprolyl isomerase [Methylophilaceae bacterium]MBL6726314.1 peptidylprolyl isomerase [Methylophilaceae bacterium]MBL6790840.1 peptidylprolyl isomerase [Methylophilaceae bacterium]